MFGGWEWGRFPQETNIVEMSERRFVKHSFWLGFDGLLYRVEVCRFKEDGIFDDSGHARYRADAYVLDRLTALLQLFMYYIVHYV